MALTLEEAQDLLGPYLDRLFMCINGAVKSYVARDPEERAILKPRTRAGIINDFMVHKALSELDLPGVRIKWHRGQFMLIIEDKARIRLKKLNKRLRPSNIPTQQALSFLNQEQVHFSFPDESPPLTDLVAGYQWNQLETGAGIWIVCPNQRTNQWVLAVEDPAHAAEVHSHPSVSPSTVDRPRRVRPKVAPEVGDSGVDGNG